MFSWIVENLLFLAIGIGAGYIGGILRTLSLHRRTYSLECAVADLENKVLIEVKRRAGQERQKENKVEQEILNLVKNSPEKAQDPWWAKYSGTAK